MKKILFIIGLCAIYSCSFKLSDETTISPKEICECYNAADEMNANQALSNCIVSLNDFLTRLLRTGFDKTKIQQLGSKGLSEITTHLSKSCEKYRQSTNDKSKAKFIFKDQEQAQSIIENLNDNQELSDTLNIAKAYLTMGKNQEAISLSEAYLLSHPKSDIAYWMKSFSHHQAGQIEEASTTIDKAIGLIENKNITSFLKLYRNALNPKLDYAEDGIKLEISRF